MDSKALESLKLFFFEPYDEDAEGAFERYGRWLCRIYPCSDAENFVNGLCYLVSPTSPDPETIEHCSKFGRKLLKKRAETARLRQFIEEWVLDGGGDGASADEMMAALHAVAAPAKPAKKRKNAV